MAADSEILEVSHEGIPFFLCHDGHVILLLCLCLYKPLHLTNFYNSCLAAAQSTTDSGWYFPASCGPCFVTHRVCLWQCEPVVKLKLFSGLFVTAFLIDLFEGLLNSSLQNNIIFPLYEWLRWVQQSWSNIIMSFKLCLWSWAKDNTYTLSFFSCGTVFSS